jgi:hypothetical protein
MSEHVMNPYSFDEFLRIRESIDFYQSDAFTQKAFQHFSPPSIREQVDKAAREISFKVSYRWRKLVERMASWDRRPYLVHYDAHGHRIDEEVDSNLPMSRSIYGAKDLSSGNLLCFKKLPLLRMPPTC